MTDIHNLDENIAEHFEFIIKGHNYKFRQPNTEEIKEIQKSSDDKDFGNENLYPFISKVNEDSPDFSETAKQMTMPYWHKFNAMVLTELGLDS